MSNKEIIEKNQHLFESFTALQCLQWALDTCGALRCQMATSFSIEDQYLTHLIATNNLPISLFTLDTGRLDQKTYDILAKTEEKYNLRIRLLFPDTAEVEDLVQRYGINCFYQSVELRKACCMVRKVQPLKKQLSTADAWICGLRREQASSRNTIEKIEWDSVNTIIKINPIADVSTEQIWSAIRDESIPYNRLYDEGYTSIGCSPCTRATSREEDVRAGRWWWENPEHKECGLHKR